MSEHWQIVGGVRWDRFGARYRSIDFASGSSVVNSLAVDRVDEAMSYRAALVLQTGRGDDALSQSRNVVRPLAEGLSLVTSGRTFNQGNAFLAPERNRLLELGGKIDVLDDKLALRTALPEAHHPRLLGIYHAQLRRWALV